MYVMCKYVVFYVHMLTYVQNDENMSMNVEAWSSCLVSYLITLYFMFGGRASNWIQSYQILPVCSGNLVSPLECCDPRRLPCFFPVFQEPELWSSYLYSKCLSTELATCLIFKFLCGCACAQGWYWDIFLYSPFNFFFWDKVSCLTWNSPTVWVSFPVAVII